MNRLTFQEHTCITSNVANERLFVKTGIINIFLVFLKNGVTRERFFLGQLKAREYLYQTTPLKYKQGANACVYLEYITESKVVLETTDISEEKVFENYLAALYRLSSENYEETPEIFGSLESFKTLKMSNVLDGLEALKNLYDQKANSNLVISNESAQRDIQYKMLSAMRKGWNKLQINNEKASKVATNDKIVSTDLSLLYAIRILCEATGIRKINDDAILTDNRYDEFARLQLFAERNTFRIREIKLNVNDFSIDYSAPLLGFIKDDQGTVVKLKPVIIYLRGGNSYYEIPNTGVKVVITSDNIPLILKKAFVIHEAFEKDIASPIQFLKFFMNEKLLFSGISLLILITSMIFSGIMPLAIYYIVDQIIPMGNYEELYQLSVLLVMFIICRVGIGLVPSMMFIVMNTRQLERFQLALYDRFLRISINSIRNYQTGDWVHRMLGTSKIFNIIYRLWIENLSNVVFALCSLGVMLYISSTLALVTFILAIIYVVFVLVLMLINLKYHVEEASLEGQSSGMLKQLFEGVAKIKVSGAENKVLARYFDIFTAKLKSSYITSRNKSIFRIVTDVMPVIITMVIFYFVNDYEQASVPLFLAFLVALYAFLVGVINIGKIIWGMQGIIPEYQKLKPLLESELENQNNRTIVDSLDGSIRLSHVSYRYDKTKEWTLNDVSMNFDSGKFVAIVGSSGSGKSSIIRLLLGFAEPESGAVYYDGRDLINLDLFSIRRRLGVVLQNSKVFPGTVLDNVMIGSGCTKEEALQALKRADMEQDITEMPMGVNTIISPDNISGGQQQRILIARALVGHPEILIMDEATSALDNISQQKIQQQLENLAITRIIIAHRLSTIRNADYIYVMDKGVCVEQGTYNELVKNGGVFEKLVSRQLVME